jgi:hypothetical protein
MSGFVALHVCRITDIMEQAGCSAMGCGRHQGVGRGTALSCPCIKKREEIKGKAYSI